MSGLQDELANLKLEESLGAEAARRLRDPQGGAASAKLMAHLEELKGGLGVSSSKKGGGDGPASSSSSSQVTYELLMKPESTKLEESERAARMEKRIEALEKALGASPKNMVSFSKTFKSTKSLICFLFALSFFQSSLSVETSEKSLLGAVSVLSARTALLDPSHLDHVEGRLASIQARMAAVKERKEVMEDHEKASK